MKGSEVRLRERERILQANENFKGIVQTPLCSSQRPYHHNPKRKSSCEQSQEPYLLHRLQQHFITSKLQC